MKIGFFSHQQYEDASFTQACQDSGHALVPFDVRLTPQTARLADGLPVVCAFVNDQLDAEVLELLAAGKTKLIALRCAGYNPLDLEAANRLGLAVVRVPAYSPHAVSEHVLALTLALNRKTHRAYNRVRDYNFTLDGLSGFDLFGKTVGIIGTGRIGRTTARMFRGLGCNIMLHDSHEDARFAEEIQASYEPLPSLYKSSRIISLHIPLLASTRHLIDTAAFEMMSADTLLINTGRGALIDSRALITALKQKRIAGAGLDVYEEEEGLFAKDLSVAGTDDDIIARLLSFPNVLVTAHQAFLTQEALSDIAQTTVQSIAAFEAGSELIHQL